jgi:hypothetical protein
MGKQASLPRRQFLRQGIAALGGALAAPHVVAAAVLGRDGGVAPSDKIILGHMGPGGRGSYDLGCFLREPDVRCVAVCDVRRERRERAKARVDAHYGNQDCMAYRDFREMFARPDIDAVLITTGNNWHGLGSILAAKAGKDVYSEKPVTRNIVESLELAAAFQRTGRVYQGGMQRRNVAHFVYAIGLVHQGRLGKLHTLHAHPAGMGTGSSGWADPEPQPSKEELDWDLYLGPAAWRPYSRRFLGAGFDKGGGMVGGGIQEWGSHCVDICQWGNQSDDTVPVEYNPPVNGQIVARYANGVKLVVRQGGWLPNIGSCPARFEGDAGWLEVGDSGNIFAEPASILSDRGAKTGGYPAGDHIRDFLNCVKTRRLPRANHFVTCNTHIACHACGIAIFLGRKVIYDPVKHVFVGDEAANRLRGEAVREPWRY